MGEGKKVFMQKYRMVMNHTIDTTLIDSIVLFVNECCALPHEGQLKIPTAVWTEMGSPEQITVTIRPGDKLN